MRLIDTSTFELKTFYNIRTRPEYSILSHTWTDNEITFEDYRPRDVSSNISGYQKIRRACRYARKASFDYIWIDTCCIDKRSSSELSEAINSMWRWYKDSEVCFAYLADVPYSEAYSRKHLMKKDREAYDVFIGSRWFMGGWTLQELIAPDRVAFLSTDWRPIGSDETLRDEIATASGIESRYLDSDTARRCSTYIKMSFAARRQTTREEDMAYCLLGLLGINMPLLYGEGAEQAFRRLQLAVVEAKHDHTLLAWRHKDWMPCGEAFTLEQDVYLQGLPCFASSVDHFRTYGCGVLALDRRDRKHFSLPGVRPYAMTNIGLHISLPCVPTNIGLYEPKDPRRRLHAIVGKVRVSGSSNKDRMDEWSCVAVTIQLCSGDPAMEDAVYVRTHRDTTLLKYEDLARSQEKWLYLRQDISILYDDSDDDL